MIINCIFEKLERFILNPRIAINCLNLIDFLLKNGSSRFKNEIENERRTIRKYSEYYSEEEEELNEPINNLAKKLVDLIDNPSKLQSERDEAAKLKNRIQGVSNEQPTQEYFSDSRYGGYSSENYSKNSTDNTKPVETPNELMETVEEKVKEPVIVADDIDLLGDNEEEEAAQQYASAVLVALREVEDALVREHSLRESIVALETASTEARAAAEIALRRYERGTADLLTRLESQRRRFSFHTPS